MPVYLTQSNCLADDIEANVVLVERKTADTIMSFDIENENSLDRTIIKAILPCRSERSLPLPNSKLYEFYINPFFRNLSYFVSAHNISSVSIPFIEPEPYINSECSEKLYLKYLNVLISSIHRSIKDLEYMRVYVLLSEDQYNEVTHDSRMYYECAADYYNYISDLENNGISVPPFKISACINADALEDTFVKEFPLSEDAGYNIPIDYFKTGNSFGLYLDYLIQDKGISPGDFVRKANISRQTLSKLRKADSVPEKYTALACAIALELNFQKTQTLLEKAGYCLSSSLKYDVIITYFITHKMYNIDLINIVLLQFGLHQLGSRK